MTYTAPNAPQARPAIWWGSLRDSWLATTDSQNSATTWTTANRALYVPLKVMTYGVVKELAYGCAATGAGNIDIGLYTSSGTRLVSTGSTAKGTINGMVSLGVTDTPIVPALYYIGLNNSTTTDTVLCWSSTAPQAATHGLLKEALGSVTLPATASWSRADDVHLFPVVGMMVVTEVS